MASIRPDVSITVAPSIRARPLSTVGSIEVAVRPRSIYMSWDRLGATPSSVGESTSTSS